MTAIELSIDMFCHCLPPRFCRAANRLLKKPLVMFERAQKMSVMVDTEARSYQAPGKEPVELPEGMDVLLTTARSELTSEDAGGIRFFPDGGSTGGHVELIVSGREYRVDVAWLTGEATLARQDENS